MVLLIAGERKGVEHLRQRKTAMGTPQMRWREMHQSGRVATMLVMRSSPQAGSQVTVLISSRARWRKVVVCGDPEANAGVSPLRCCAASVEMTPPKVEAAGMGVSMAMNHCSVARVMTGLWQRQQWG